MSDEAVDAMIRAAIGGDAEAQRLVVARADSIDESNLLTMAALLERTVGRLDRATSVARTSRDRQVVVIARAHLGGDGELVDALVRDHLVDHPDSLIVAWIAADATARRRSGPGRDCLRS